MPFCHSCQFAMSNNRRDGAKELEVPPCNPENYASYSPVRTYRLFLFFLPPPPYDNARNFCTCVHASEARCSAENRKSCKIVSGKLDFSERTCARRGIRFGSSVEKYIRSVRNRYYFRPSDKNSDICAPSESI